MTVRPQPAFVNHPGSATEIAARLDELLEHETFKAAEADPLREALVHVAARYGEIVTAALNLSPQCHLDELSMLLGQHGRLATAARVHLSFKPTASPSGDAVPVR